MPIHEFGYRAWSGAKRPRWTRFWSITRTGIALAKQPLFVRRLCFLAVLPLLYLGLFFFGVGALTDPENGSVRGPIRGLLESALGPSMMRQLRDDPAAVRELIWNDMFLGAHTWALPSVALILIAVAPKLISNDLRTKAFLLYFSKPIGRTDYLIGKAGILAGYVAWFTFVPAFGAYVLSVLFAPNIDALHQTWTIVPSIVAASLITIIPLTAIGLFVSSTTRDQRVATFALIAIIVGGEITFGILANLTAFEGSTLPMMFSIREMLANAMSLAFDPPRLTESFINTPRTNHSLIVLAGLTVATTFGTWRRISAPMNA